MSSTAGEADALLVALRDRVLRKLLTAYALGSLAISLLFVLQAAQVGAFTPRLWWLVAGGQLALVLRLVHRRLGFRRTALAFLAYLWALPATFQVLRGMTPGTALSYLALLMLSGLFFGRRGALIGFFVCLATLLGGGALVATRAIEPATPDLWDLHSPVVWLRYALVFAMIGGALAVVFNDVIGALVDSTRRLHDTLARERAERARREAAQAGLERAQRLESLAQLAGGIAHDFNNSLSIIMSGLDLIHGDTANPPATRKLAGEVADTAEVAAKSVRQLLALGRHDGERPERVCAADLLSRARPSLQRMLNGHTQLELNVDSRAEVRIDVARLTQAVVNLAINARDAMPGGGRLTLSVDECERAEVPSGWLALPGRFVRLTCSDTGSGMDVATQQRIFEPFFTTKPPGQGTGLGLAMVHASVRDAGGFVEVESELGRGTRIALYLPMLARPVATHELQAAARA
jgi:signal transduction histidine kinase